MNNSNLVKRRSLLQGFVAGGLAAAFSGPSHAADTAGSGRPFRETFGL